MKLRERIFSDIKFKFENAKEWSEMEMKISNVCTKIPEILTNLDKSTVIAKIYEIISILHSFDFKDKHTVFLKDMIGMLDEISQMQVHTEKNENLDESLIKKYATLSYNSEGVIGLDNKFNAEQLKKLTNGVFAKTNQIKFFISKELEVEGKVTAEFYDTAQMLPVATLCESNKVDKDYNPVDRVVKLFGERLDTRTYKILKEIKIPFYMYKFLSKSRREYILMSINRLELGDYIISGTNIESDDYRIVSETTKIKTKLQFLFGMEIIEKKIVYKSIDHFRTMMRSLKVSKKTMYDFPFTIWNKKTQQLEVLAYFDWYKNFIWAWLLHAREGLQNEYPLHLMILGPPGSAKSYLLNCLHPRTNEILPIFEGSGSTLKSLVPSFASKPPRVGYLGESSRFALCDEFLRCLPGIRNNSVRHGEIDESVGIMNSLLEHQQRDMGSGNSRISVNMTSRILAVSNLLMGVRTMEDLCNKLDMSFLGRWLIYFQHDEDIQLIRKARKEPLKKHEHNFSNEDFVSIIDYMQQQMTHYDKLRVNEIYDEPKPLLSDVLIDHYESRHDHHIICLMDGIIKTRCLFENDMSFTAKDEDYDSLRNIWLQVIKSWIVGKKIKNIPVEKRLWYMPSKIQYLFTKMSDQKCVLTRDEIKELVSDDFTVRELTDSLIILIDNELLHEDYGEYRPYWLGRVLKKSMEQ